MKNVSRFPDWMPKVGERAIRDKKVVVLTGKDVDTINLGIGEYAPVRVKLVDKSLIGTRDESSAVIDVFVYNEQAQAWWGSFSCKNLASALRQARRYYGPLVEYVTAEMP